MLRRSNKSLIAVCGLLVICLFVIFFSTSLHGSEKYYEIRPEITVPAYKTDIDRVIDSYERLMNNYVYLIEKNVNGISLDISNLAEKIELIDQKMTDLSIQIQSIQDKLGIEISEKEKFQLTPSDKNLESKVN